MVELSRRERIVAYTTGGFGLSMNAILYLLVPLRASELGASIGVIGLLVGTKALAETVLSVPIGAFMDRTGPRKALLIGTLGTAVIGVAMALAPSVLLLFVLQLAMGVVRPLGWLGGQSYAAGMRGGKSRAYDTGKFGFAANVGQIVAPLVAGAVAGLAGTAAAFLVVVAWGLVFFALSWTLPDAGRAATTKDSGSGFGAAGTLLRIQGVQVVMLLTFTRLWIPAVWSAFFPLYLVSEGLSPALAGSVLSFMGVAASVTSLLTGRIAALGGPIGVTAFSLLVSLLGVGLSGVWASVPLAYVVAALVGFGQGLSLPMLITLTSQAVPAEVRSLALGLRSGVNQAAATLAPVIVGPLIGATGAGVGFPVAAVIGGLFIAGALARGRGAVVEDAERPAT
ncbi:MFS transporter [Actinotalea sp. Marseille-Q4924]|uniref:MFS transporter n=1 Tax=Actinotalea sp. Marseille-Q4924 TaxID=2866571 RepID=UPI001CE40997|nr:MFS transporter [Actinotalea sp. Marseille-Q4924]